VSIGVHLWTEKMSQAKFSTLLNLPQVFQHALVMLFHVLDEAGVGDMEQIKQLR
jgi:hypothetical protein